MHFFIDNFQLTEQNISDSFGIFNNDQNLFKITSEFQLLEKAKAFACQDGMIIIQQSAADENLVNIILNPRTGLEIPFSSVKYFVYRGVSKDSLFVNGQLIPKSKTPENSFLQRIWDEVDGFRTNFNLPNHPDPTPKDFGYDNDLPSTLEIEKVFNNSQSNTFPIYIKEGECIGNFGNSKKIGFEIILETDNLENPSFDNQITLGYLRKQNHTIDVSDLSGFEKRAKQELVLSYIDPCAFFGLHYDVGVDISVFSGNTKNVVNKKQTELYNELLNKFYNKNKIYLDIRSENGYSYNFYQNYKDANNKNVKIENGISEYETDSWPILILNSPNKDKVNINLRIDDNLKPILFSENRELFGKQNNSVFLDDTKLLNGNDTDWTKNITLNFPIVGSKNVAYYAKLCYFRQENNVNSPNSILKNDKYYSNAFCPIDLKKIADIDYTFQQCFNSDFVYCKGKLPNINNPFSFVSETGANWDATRIIFYAKSVFKNERTGIFLNNQTTKDNAGFTLDGNFNKTSFLSSRISLNVNKIQEKKSATIYDEIKVIDIVQNKDFTGAVEDLICFGITTDEFSSLKNITNFSDLYHRYIYLEELTESPFTDKDGKIFRKYEAKVQGFDNTGKRLIKSSENPIYVYTQNGLVFASKEFSSGYEAVDGKNYLENFMKILDSNSPVTTNFFDGLINFTTEEFNNLANAAFWQNYTNGKTNKSLFELDISIKTIILDFKEELDNININKQSIENLVKIKGAELLNYAKQSIRNNWAAKNKDGILYLSRLIMQIILKNHPKIIANFYNDVEYFSNLFEKHSRGLEGAEKPDFSTYPNFKILISGYDPFGSAFPASYFDWEGHQSNPSGNLALSLDGVELIANNGKKAIIKSVILPVRFKEFDEDWIEDFFTPYVKDNTVKLIITFSYGVDGKIYNFEMERFASRKRGIGTPDNNNDGAKESFYLNKSDKDNSEFIETTLPFNDMFISSEIGLDQKAAFKYYNNGVSLNKEFYINNYDKLTNSVNHEIDPFSPAGKIYNNDLQATYYNKIAPIDISNYPMSGANKIKSLQGSGGDYLSNEVYYRVAFLRKTLNPNKMTGHIHVGFLKGNSKIDRDEMLSIIKNALTQTIKNF